MEQPEAPEGVRTVANVISSGGHPELPVVAHYLREFARPTETFVVNQIDRLTGYDGLVMCRSLREGVPTPDSGRPVDHIRSFGGESSGGPLSDLAYRRARLALPAERRWYRDVLTEERSVVVHAHFGTDAGYLWPAIRSTGLPLVVSWYGYDVAAFPRTLGGAGRLWLRPVLQGARLHLAMTPNMADALVDLGAPPDSVRIHHHGIDVSAWSSEATRAGSLRGHSRLLMVASLTEKKGHEDLVRLSLS